MIMYTENPSKCEILILLYEFRKFTGNKISENIYFTFIHRKITEINYKNKAI